MRRPARNSLSKDLEMGGGFPWTMASSIELIHDCPLLAGLLIFLVSRSSSNLSRKIDAAFCAKFLVSS